MNAGWSYRKDLLEVLGKMTTTRFRTSPHKPLFAQTTLRAMCAPWLWKKPCRRASMICLLQNHRDCETLVMGRSTLACAWKPSYTATEHLVFAIYHHLPCKPNQLA